MKVSLPLVTVLLFAMAQISPAINDGRADEQVSIQETRSLSNDDLAAIILQACDLPTGYSAGKVRFGDPSGFKHLPITKNIVNLQIKKKRKLEGGTTVLYYMTDEEANRAYLSMLDGLGESGSPGRNIQDVKNIGERAVLAGLNMAISVNGAIAYNFNLHEFIFIRCHAIIDIRLSDPNIILSYAQKLDQRILSSLCRSD